MLSKRLLTTVALLTLTLVATASAHAASPDTPAQASLDTTATPDAPTAREEPIPTTELEPIEVEPEARWPVSGLLDALIQGLEEGFGGFLSRLGTVAPDNNPS